MPTDANGNQVSTTTTTDELLDSLDWRTPQNAVPVRQRGRSSNAGNVNRGATVSSGYDAAAAAAVGSTNASSSGQVGTSAGGDPIYQLPDGSIVDGDGNPYNGVWTESSEFANDALDLVDSIYARYEDVGQVDFGEFVGNFASVAGSVQLQNRLDSQAAIEQNIANFGRLSDTAAEGVGSSGAILEDMIAESYYDSLDALAPNWRESVLGTSEAAAQDIYAIASDVQKNVYPKLVEPAMELYEQGAVSLGSFLKGEVPQDVYDYLAQSQAETMQAFGITGTSAGSAGAASLATQLGLLSTDLVAQGMQLMPSLSSFGTEVLGYGTAAQATGLAAQQGATNLQTNILGFMPQQLDYSSIWNTAYGSLLDSSLINTSDVAGLTQASLSTTSDISRSNAEASVSVLTSAMGFGADVTGYKSVYDAAIR